MKIQCDACNREEASVFCSADEAALCNDCDGRIHHANKLASKHLRLSLLHPSTNDAPLCDICQERRAFLFCREDRAILCRECDLPIHSANDLTRNHSRFLLTGIKLSSSIPSPLFATTGSAAASSSSQQAMKEKKKKKPVSAELGFPSSPSSEMPAVASGKEGSRIDGVYTSSISEYLIETLPGWHVEDLFDSSAPPPLEDTDELLPFVEAEHDGDLGLISEDLGKWIPQVPQMNSAPQPTVTFDWEKGVGFIDSKELDSGGAMLRWTADDGFTVPQID